MAGYVTINGAVTSLPAGAEAIGPLTIVATGTVGQTTDITLASGDNTITVPATATACVIVPPTSNTVVLKLKGAAGDTGVTISPTNPTVIAFPASPGNFIINAASTTASATEVKFI